MPILDNPKHERFAQLVGTGETATEAYRTVWGTTGTSAEQSASRLRKQVKVSSRISEIAAGYVKHLDQQAGKDIKARYLSLDRKRELLALIAETPISEVDDKNVLCQSVKRSKSKDGTTVEFRMPDKLRAIELDAKLAHELTDKIEVKDVTLKEPLADIRERLIQANRLRAQPTHGVS